MRDFIPANLLVLDVCLWLYALHKLRFFQVFVSGKVPAADWAFVPSLSDFRTPSVGRVMTDGFVRATTPSRFLSGQVSRARLSS